MQNNKRSSLIARKCIICSSNSLKKSPIIINISRGKIINETDLIQALKNNVIKGAALDVFKKEPLEESELFNLENIILTPHIAASTDEAQIVVAEMVANQFCEYFKNNNVVNSIT